MSQISVILILFFVMDPFGNITVFLKQLKEYPLNQKRLIIIREMLFALAAMLLFNFFGEYLLQFLDISETTVYIASSIILFLVALQILYPTVDSIRNKLPPPPPFVIPLAIPLVAGPSLMATIMLFAHQEESVGFMLISIFIAWVFVLSILLIAPELKRIFGSNGLTAIEKVTGMILVMLAIQRFLEGVNLFIKT